MKIHEILDLHDFIEIKRKGNGFLTITDKNLPKNCVHNSSCYEVNEKFFNQKVIINNGKNGSCYYSEDLNEVFDRFSKMSECQKCFD